MSIDIAIEPQNGPTHRANVTMSKTKMTLKAIQLLLCILRSVGHVDQRVGNAQSVYMARVSQLYWFG
jgi:hypothetical protein